MNLGRLPRLAVEVAVVYFGGEAKLRRGERIVLRKSKLELKYPARVRRVLERLEIQKKKLKLKVHS